jgi:hypothetical protein
MIKNTISILGIMATIAVSYSVIIIMCLFVANIFVDNLDLHPGLIAFFTFNTCASFLFLIKYLLETAESVELFCNYSNSSTSNIQDLNPIEDRIPKNKRDK